MKRISIIYHTKFFKINTVYNSRFFTKDLFNEKLHAMYFDNFI